LDYDQLASEFIRALRGKRSQPAFCRRLGYKSNVAYTWESGRGFPTAARALWAAEKVGVPVRAAYEEFYRRVPPWLAEADPATPEGVARFLSELKGRTSIVELATYTGKSRFAIARWLKGETEPKLPEFFELIECSSLRLVDFLEQLVDPKKMPSLRERWESIQVARRVAYDAPWTQAVLRALELDAYKALPRHEPGWLASKIGIDAGTEAECLALLVQTGQVRLEDGRYALGNVAALDTRKNPVAAAKLRTWWGHQALERFALGSRGMMYNLMSVSAADLERLRELQKAYFNEIRTIVAQSQPIERVALATVQLLDLGERPDDTTP
jgi:transcriptional regulator with XRE-family HTH domain